MFLCGFWKLFNAVSLFFRLPVFQGELHSCGQEFCSGKLDRRRLPARRQSRGNSSYSLPIHPHTNPWPTRVVVSISLLPSKSNLPWTLNPKEELRTLLAEIIHWQSSMTSFQTDTTNWTTNHVSQKINFFWDILHSKCIIFETLKDFDDKDGKNNPNFCHLTPNDKYHPERLTCCQQRWQDHNGEVLWRGDH